MKSFAYNLPEEKIARYPLPERDQSRLLIFHDRKISEDRYRNLASHLPEGALLVLNNTRVVEARILFRKPSGGTIEIFALEPHPQYSNPEMAMNAKGKVWWKCLIGGAGKWKHGQLMQKELTRAGESIILEARIVEKSINSFTIEFTWEPADIPFSEIMQLSGVMPIPPYLKRETQDLDQQRYQTIYASEKGSVAAPTAGLHITDEVFHSLSFRQIEKAFITLHVSAGTFMPVKREILGEHEMHEEYIHVQQALIKQLIEHAENIFAVGTTSLRTLESLYWMGIKCYLSPGISLENLAMKQWEVYEESYHLPVGPVESLTCLLNRIRSEGLESLFIKTQILIAPPYRPKMIKGLITNFHQPSSTLLLLVAALIGDDWHKVYDYALMNDFRFLSYGDGCLLYVH